VLPGAEHAMEMHMVAKGSGWAAILGLAPVRIEAGDIVVFPQGDAHVLSSAPGLEPERITPDWVFATRHEPEPMPVAFHRGVREGGGTPVTQAESILVCGFLGCDLRPFNPLVGALPRLLHLPAARAGDWIARIMDQSDCESTERRPGADAVLERLAETVFVDTSRRYLDALAEDATGWLAGLRDRYVGRALALLHEEPEHPWTIDELGQRVGLSRSALHERFLRFLGEPPMHSLANWRIQVGSRLLRESGRTVAHIALAVGYEAEAAFSRAFKRLVGTPPAAWRRAAGAR
jgi:AraC-like DNA-binding protein